VWPKKSWSYNYLAFFESFPLSKNKRLKVIGVMK